MTALEEIEFEAACHRIAALEAEVAELRKNAVQLYTGLIRARQSLFPHVDQEKVMARDYPKIASLKEAS
jgi:hypothetical protein